MAWQGTSAPSEEIRLGPVLVNGGARRERVVVLLEACCLLMVENSSREDLKLLRLPALARSCRLFWRHCSELWPPTRRSRIKACQGVSRAVIAVMPLLELLKMFVQSIDDSCLLLHELCTPCSIFHTLVVPRDDLAHRETLARNVTSRPPVQAKVPARKAARTPRHQTRRERVSFAS